MHSLLLNCTNFFYNSKFYLVLLLSYAFNSLLLDTSCMFFLFQQILKNNNTRGPFILFSVILIQLRWSLTYHPKLAEEILHSTVIWDKTFKKKFGAVWDIWESRILCPAKELDFSFSRNWCLHLLYYINNTFTFSKERKEKTVSLFQCCCSKIIKFDFGLHQRLWNILEYISRGTEKMIWDKLHPCILFNILKNTVLITNPDLFCREAIDCVANTGPLCVLLLTPTWDSPLPIKIFYLKKNQNFWNLSQQIYQINNLKSKPNPNQIKTKRCLSRDFPQWDLLYPYKLFCQTIFWYKKSSSVTCYFVAKYAIIILMKNTVFQNILNMKESPLR